MASSDLEMGAEMKWSELSSRQRDALVAERVLGYQCVCDVEPADCPIHNIADASTLLPYSMDIAAAWEVVEHLRPRFGFSLHDWPEIRVADYEAEFQVRDEVGEGYPNFTGEANTAPKAICLAALKACGVEVN